MYVYSYSYEYVLGTKLGSNRLRVRAYLYNKKHAVIYLIDHARAYVRSMKHPWAEFGENSLNWQQLVLDRWFVEKENIPTRTLTASATEFPNFPSTNSLNPQAQISPLDG